MAQQSLDPILRPAQVAAELGISLSTLYRMRLAGQMPPAVRLSARAIGWRRSSIDTYIDRQTDGGRR